MAAGMVSLVPMLVLFVLLEPFLVQRDDVGGREAVAAAAQGAIRCRSSDSRGVAPRPGPSGSV